MRFPAAWKIIGRGEGICVRTIRSRDFPSPGSPGSTEEEAAQERQREAERLREAERQRLAERQRIRMAQRKTERVEINVQPELDFSSAAHERAHPQTALVPVASLIERRKAGFLDAIFLGLTYAGFLGLFRSLGGQLVVEKADAVVYLAAFFLFYALYFSLFTTCAEATPGMQLLCLTTVRLDGTVPDTRQLLWRSFGYLLAGGHADAWFRVGAVGRRSFYLAGSHLADLRHRRDAADGAGCAGGSSRASQLRTKVKLGRVLARLCEILVGGCVRLWPRVEISAFFVFFELRRFLYFGQNRVEVRDQFARNASFSTCFLAGSATGALRFEIQR